MVNVHQLNRLAKIDLNDSNIGILMSDFKEFKHY